jgi:hypothetical protein
MNCFIGAGFNIFIKTADAALSRVEIHLELPIADTSNNLHSKLAQAQALHFLFSPKNQGYRGLGQG